MTTTDIRPLPSGRAVADVDGSPQDFDNWDAAVAEVRRRGRTPNVLPFPPLRFDVLETAPALRVLT